MPRIAKWIGDAMEDLLASKVPVMKVLEIERLSPKVKRIRFKGNLSGMNFHLGYAVAVRVSDTEYRNYTPSYSDASAGILEIVVHLHGPAPGSNLMDALKPGDELRISMPRGRKMYDSSFDKHVFFGDETLFKRSLQGDRCTTVRQLAYCRFYTDGKCAVCSKDTDGS